MWILSFCEKAIGGKTVVSESVFGSEASVQILQQKISGVICVTDKNYKISAVSGYTLLSKPCQLSFSQF